MTYDIQTFLLASNYGRDRGLTTPEIAKLAEHIQEQLEEEMNWLLKLREVQQHAHH